MRIRALATAAILAAFALPVAAQEAADRYVIDLTVMENGVEVMSARTLISEQHPADITLLGGGTEYVFNGSLSLVQGDGDEEKLMLEAYLGRDGEDVSRPVMMMRRGGTALMRTGRTGPDEAVLIDGVEIEISPLPST